jgi:UDP-N-acetylmuramoyl-L-alanyl-D-glutamate--2,6-diaminopimelate ligase
VTDLAPSALRPQHPIPRSLAGLVEDFSLETRGDIGDLLLTGISLSSRCVQPGDLFVGVPGARAHGATFAAAARDAGAVAVLTDDAGANLAADCGLPVVVTRDVRAALGEIAGWIHQSEANPATLFAVTGTNGKTSVVYLLFAILTQLGITAGLTSTAERRIGAVSVTSALTTPEATELHALLARMRESDVGGVVVEVSAQALSQHRIDGLRFDVAGFTNLSHDHLDDYLTMDTYFQAKLDLFQPARARRGVVTVDTDWGRRVAAGAGIPVTTLANLPFGPRSPIDQGPVDADWHMTVLESSARYTEFVLEGRDGRRVQTRVPLLGWFMAANAALAIVLLIESGIELAAIDRVLTRDGGIVAYVPGRAELISGERGPLVYIDYGHSPDAFLNTLGAIRASTTGRIIMVFGADGDRDKTKRAAMGAIAATGADAVVITDFHPRFEDPALIRATLMAAAKIAAPNGELYEIPDPATAFRRALSLAGVDDVVLYAGPGHEDYQEVAGVKIPYSAREDARAALQEAGWL